MSTTVEVRNVEKRFGRQTAVAGISFELQPGITGLLGPNGAGKTTLERMVATVLAPDRGSITILGYDPSQPLERHELRRRLGYMPQEPGFYRHFTVFDFVDYVAILKEMTDRPARHDEVRRVLELTGLTSQSKKRIRALSGGMRRRVALAQALLDGPDLLVLDEPTAGLDPEQRLRFRQVISTIGEDRTVVISTHQTEDVAALCSRVIVMHEGQVRFSGTPRELADLAAGRVWIDADRDPRAELAWRTGEGTVRHIGDAPGGATLAEPTIEDAYLLLVGDQATTEVAA